uniref:Protein SEC13 homolog n=1 Tax=Parascaris univalens TaxID=6257 RepID=A0A915CGV3_PARUN
MVSVVTKVDTAHRDIIHDAQMNYYGTRLATCSSDRLVKIFELKPSGQTYPLAELSGHDGPVWQVVWAHPKFDNVLASCSYDRKVIIWKEVSGKWQKIYEWSDHEASVNSICWAPHQFGLILACASTDTTISLLTYVPETNAWTSRKILKAHDQGCNAVSWAPAVHSQSFVEAGMNSVTKRIVSGGNDNIVKIWKEKKDGTWELEHALKGHADWVRDVAWAPAIGQPVNTIASCGQDRKVIIWRCSNVDEGQWVAKELGNFDDALWHVSWSLCATILAVSGGDNKISLWKENLQNVWIRISETEEEKRDA